MKNAHSHLEQQITNVLENDPELVENAIRFDDGLISGSNTHTHNVPEKEKESKNLKEFKRMFFKNESKNLNNIQAR